jgi:hypothetical protein
MPMAARAGATEARDAAPVPKPILEAVARGHPLRRSLEQCIATRFARAYGAQLTQFLPHLVGIRDAQSRWLACAGYGGAGAGPLFLEQYLDAPVEALLDRRVLAHVAREQVVEVGNLAAVSAGMARAMIPLLARHLHRLGYRWVAFTATREVRNAFHRIGLAPILLAAADAGRLPDGGAAWGTYYERDPLVMAGRIALGLRAATMA